MSSRPAVMHFPTEGDEKMRASKLIIISTVAVSALAILTGGTSFAVEEIAVGSQQGNGSIQGRSTNPRAAESLMHRSEISGQRSSKTVGSRHLERGQAMTAEYGRATASQGPGFAGQTQGRSRLGPNQNAPAYARGSTRDIDTSLNAPQRMRLRDIVATRPDIPRVSKFDSNVRINALAPRNVRLAVVPEEVARMYPRFRRDRLFIYRGTS
jgi:hypothetical protein